MGTGLAVMWHRLGSAPDLAQVELCRLMWREKWGHRGVWGTGLPPHAAATGPSEDTASLSRNRQDGWCRGFLRPAPLGRS